MSDQRQNPVIKVQKCILYCAKIRSHIRCLAMWGKAVKDLILYCSVFGYVLLIIYYIFVIICFVSWYFTFFVYRFPF